MRHIRCEERPELATLPNAFILQAVIDYLDELQEEERYSTVATDGTKDILKINPDAL